MDAQAFQELCERLRQPCPVRPLVLDAYVAAMPDRAKAITAADIAGGADRYDRQRDLPALLRIDAATMRCPTAGVAQDIIERLERAFHAEQNRARTGHWSGAGMSAWRATSFRIAIEGEKRIRAAAVSNILFPEAAA